MSGISTIIVAAGKGLRMGSELPKQFLSIGGVPILMRTISSFYNAIGEHQIIIALPETYIETWHTLCRNHTFNIEHEVVLGGDNRYDSVKNALSKIDDNIEVALVHDGVRPFVSTALIDKIVTATRLHGNAIPYTKITDSLRELKVNKTKSIDRDNYIKVQTPQGFRLNILKKAYERDLDPSLTDDASVVERDGNLIHIVEAEDINIKITTPFDIMIAEALIRDL